MKEFKKKKLIVTSLTSLVVLCLVGSLSGTIAWYQNSTRASASIIGTDTSTSGNLKVMLGTGDKASVAKDEDWVSELKSTDIYAYIQKQREDDTKSKKEELDKIQEEYDAAEDKTDALKKKLTDAKETYDEANTLQQKTVGDVTLVTNYLQDSKSNLSSAPSKEGELGGFYNAPTYQIGSPSSWGIASKNDYIQFSMTLKNEESGRLSSEEKEVYVEDLTILSTDTNSLLSDAIRVHMDVAPYTKDVDENKNTTYKKGTSQYTLVSKNTAETITYGPLDLNSDDKFDFDRFTYEFSKNQDYLNYGVDGSKQTSYTVDEVKGVKDNTGKVFTSGHSIGTIPADGYLTITLTLWIEGWHTYKDIEGESNPVATASADLEGYKDKLDEALKDYFKAGEEDKSAKEKVVQNYLTSFKEAYDSYLKAQSSTGQYIEAKNDLLQAAKDYDEKSDEDSQESQTTSTTQAAVKAFFTCLDGQKDVIDAIKFSNFDETHQTVDSLDTIKEMQSHLEDAKNNIVGINEARDTFMTALDNIEAISYIWDDALKNVNFQVGITFGV